MDMQIRQGETLTLNIQSDDPTAENVRLVVKKPNENAVIDIMADFSVVDGETVAIIETSQTNLPVGVYEYMLTITYSDASIKKLPDASDCEEGDCDLPELTICEAIDLEVS